MFERAIWLLTQIFYYVAAAAAALMMLHVTIDVASKLFLSQPIIGTLETVSLFYMVAVVFLPLAAVQRDRAQVFVELFTHNLSPRGRAAVDIFAFLLSLAFLAILFWKNLEVAIEKTADRELSTNIEFQVEVWPGRWLPVIGFGFAMLWSLMQVVQSIFHAATGRPTASESAAGAPADF